MMDWFLVTCGGAAVYAAGRWLQSRLQGRRDRACLSGNQRRGIPLKAVVANCEAKWFLQELQQAMSGDHTAMVRVSHMLLVGYGTRQDEAAAATWMRKAWALQNFKEPADPYLQYDMLDLRNSDIPVLNDDLEPASAGSETQSTQPNTAAAMAAAGEAAHAAGGLRRRTRQSSNSSRRHSGTQEAAPSVLPGHGQAAGAGAGVSGAPVGIRAQPVLDAGCSSSGSGADSTGVQAGAGGGQGSRSGSSRAAASATRQHAAAVQDEALASQALQRQQLQQHSLQHQQQQQPPLLPLVKAAEQATPQTALQLPQATVAMPAAVMVVQQQLAAMAAAGRPAAGQDQQQQGSLAEQWTQLSAQLLSSCAP